MTCWMMFPTNWTLPVGGAIVGFITNWIALKLIFEPVHKTEILGGLLTVQGMFLTRQKEVSAECSKYLAENVLTSQKIWESILLGENVKNFEKIITTQVPFLTESMVKSIMKSLKEQLVVEGRPKSISLDESAQDISDVATGVHLATIDSSTENQHPLHDYINSACRIEAILVHSMERLTPKEFERVIHPVFEEDETTLIVAGGALGALAGYLQWWVNVMIDRRNERLMALAKPPIGSALGSIGTSAGTGVNTFVASKATSSVIRGLCTLVTRGRIK
jgi:uncharacterized membrane protein YheB (UPF0754 family)